MEISVVIPAFNEESRLPATLTRLAGFLGADAGELIEIVVVDDGSADGTSRAAASAGIGGVRVLRHDRNRGKGAAARTGVLSTRGDVVVVTDADGNYLTGDARPFLDAIRSGADVVLASRSHPASAWRVTPASARYVHRRRAIGRVFSALVEAVTGMALGDTQTGLKLFRGDSARGLFRDVALDGFAYDVELLCRARRRRLRIVEVPFVYRVPTPESRVRWLDPPRMALDLLRARWLCRGEPRSARVAGAGAASREREAVGAS